MNPYSEYSIKANDIDLHYYRSTPAAPRLSIILLHGITDNGMCWVRVAEALRDQYDLILADSRGHGFSDAPESGYSSKERAADVAGLIEALELDRPVLLGHSMGADTATATAALYPDLIRAAILEDPPWREGLLSGSNEEERKQRAEGWRAEILKNRAMTKEALIEMARTNSPTWHEDELGPWADSKLQVSPNVVNFIGAVQQPWHELAQKITCPVLLITADPALGAIVEAETAQQAMGLLDKGTLLHIPGAGHNIRREQFEVMMAGVRAFLQEIESA